MPNYIWRCHVCDCRNEAETYRCARCGCPDEVNAYEIEERKRRYELHPENYPLVAPAQFDKPRDPTRRADGSNIVPINELVRSVFLSIVGLWLAWSFLKDERAIFSFGKGSHTYIEVSGFFSSLLGALSILAIASSAISVVADHFDRRPNESIYKKINGYFLTAFISLALLSILVGWQLEHIQVLRR